MSFLRPIKKLLIRAGYYSKPSFMILGEAKAGTTALADILNQHTQLKGSSRKEVRFFNDESWYSHKSLPQYHEYYPLPIQIDSGTKLFDATPLYLYHPHVAERLHGYRPDLKFIILLRNPEKRAFSHWTMTHHVFGPSRLPNDHDRRSFTQAIDAEMKDLATTTCLTNKHSYVKRGIYSDNIAVYLKYFERSQFLFVESDALLKRFDETMPEILSFLEVPFEPLKLCVSNTATKDERLKYAQDILRLREFYRPHNERLFTLLGRRLASF